MVHLDNILIIGHSEESTREAVKLVVNLFESLGFVIQGEKSILGPSQVLEYIVVWELGDQKMFFL